MKKIKLILRNDCVKIVTTPPLKIEISKVESIISGLSSYQNEKWWSRLYHKVYNYIKKCTLKNNNGWKF